jgi:hypothetical protein
MRFIIHYENLTYLLSKIPKLKIYNTVLQSSCRYEKQFLSLRGKYKLQNSGNKIKKILGPTRDKVTEQFTILYNE